MHLIHRGLDKTPHPIFIYSSKKNGPPPAGLPMCQVTLINQRGEGTFHPPDTRLPSHTKRIRGAGFQMSQRRPRMPLAGDISGWRVCRAMATPGQCNLFPLTRFNHTACPPPRPLLCIFQRTKSETFPCPHLPQTVFSLDEAAPETRDSVWPASSTQPSSPGTGYAPGSGWFFLGGGREVQGPSNQT